MPTIDEAKAMARRLRDSLAARAIEIPHSAALELVAAELGYDDWNTASARLDQELPGSVRFLDAIPILRIFDEGKAREFYCEWLSFAVRFEHRFGPGMPLYMSVSRSGVELHLSEHHGDSSPGSTVFVPMQGVRELHRELMEKNYNYGRPGIEQQPWGDVLQVHDPFGNRIRFCQLRT